MQREKKEKLVKFFEIVGSLLAMVYSILIASNSGNEIVGFTLLLLSALLFAGWGAIEKRWSFLLLQIFYIISAIVGLSRWS